MGVGVGGHREGRWGSLVLRDIQRLSRGVVTPR